ncbi:pyruvate:ferredoxin (flavodoxin) oxidoreductase [Puniceicoccus vermicola]|uniref:Pyruvate:ferredoxin (Flavodoxin) oxidoreductase n=1 Tax=Puniceicoccus vermicola TaxID=388746 RepID=A0A7X1AX36_9BACT|nr:pyruvate:ferredoxin (flavodoxin) oxidoreductase [Puniceicoccus vermicola]MBC2601374.1 pyruvate:ferredoxin (flavodoxin) oxidoreductase [Puniceicoccus vermicola]
MKNSQYSIHDANEAVASVAYRLSETIAIYPITPSTPMAEHCDEWSSQGKPNLWQITPEVSQLQSEGGVAGAIHGSLQAGTLSTTFTASQGLLLMIPNMYKIAGELTPFCLHVTARSLATHALSIFGDHSDVMACRQTGFALLASNSVQEAQDLAAISHAATLKSRIPFLHFFDGFRTSHEINTYQTLSDSELRDLIPMKEIHEFRQRGLTPDAPILRGTAQNPDVFFQAREAANTFYDQVPTIVEDTMETFHRITGRSYHLYEYTGAEDAEDVLILMGSGAETAEETSEWLNQQGRKTGVLKIRLFRPFSVKRFLQALPSTVRRIAVLDRTKEPGAIGEPLYQDVLSALAEGRSCLNDIESPDPIVIGGRYGLGSKEFTPAMVKAVYDNLASETPKNHFTVGIEDDVTHLSLEVGNALDIEPEDSFRAVFVGLGSDGTVGANKNSIKIIGTETDDYAQAYFVYDSKKSGAMTVSHLRFGPKPIRAPYLISNAGFVGCHQFSFIDRFDVLSYAGEGAVFLLNSPHGPEAIWDRLPRDAQQTILEKKLKFYVIDAYKVAREAKMGNRINTVMQTCFFAISGILPRDEAIGKIKGAIQKTYGKKGQAIVEKNFAAVDQSLANLHEVKISATEVTSTREMLPPVPEEAPDFVKRVTGVMLAGKGDLLPVSAFPPDGVWPTATSQWEKRGIAQAIPVWDPSLCIQCGKCSLVCPHAAIRAKAFPQSCTEELSENFRSIPYKSKEVDDFLFTIQTAPEDCTGCNLCVTVCPAKDRKNPGRKAINMTPLEDAIEQERKNYNEFLQLPEIDPAQLKLDVKTSQLRRPLFEYSGACAGCGETPYIKLLTQLMGDRLVIANATGCSSIYGGNLPTTPYTVDQNGRGPAWANSLFEDNAEFGFGIRFGIDKKAQMAREYLGMLGGTVGDNRVRDLLTAPQTNDREIAEQRARVSDLKITLSGNTDPRAVALMQLADFLVKKSVWCVGGDGWAYDIGFGGLDHVLASGKNINVLVLDTEVYSNTGGQASKSTPMGAVAKFAAGGKSQGKKDLGLVAMSYGHIYVASVALGAKDKQTLDAIAEADAYDGPSLIIAYSHCVGHGYNLNFGIDQQKKAVQSGYWPLFRFDPRRPEGGETPLQMDSSAPRIALKDYIENEVRFRMLFNSNPERAKMLHESAEGNIARRYEYYTHLAGSKTAK